METNVKVLGWLYVVLGIMGVLAGIFVFAILSGAGWISGDLEAARITTVVGLFVAAIVTLISAPGIIVGVGLLNFKSWARILALILGALNLPGFPIGTALGIYSFVVLLNDETEQLFARRP